MNWLPNSLKPRLLCVLLGVVVCGAASAEAPTKFSFGRFGETWVYRPATVEHAAIFFSDEHGWSKQDEALAEALAAHGVLVAGIDYGHYAKELSKPHKKCSYLAGEFEDYSHELQKKYSPLRYHVPVLIGIRPSASLVYGVAAQGSSGTFIGFLTIGFERQWRPPLQLCESYELRYRKDKRGTITFKPSPKLSTPWIALQASEERPAVLDAMRKFVTAVGTAKLVVVDKADVESSWREPVLQNVAALARPDHPPKVLASELGDLPLEEVRAAKPSNTMALFLTGDGGWASIDKGVSAQLAARGIDVVALSSLQYFWQARTPEQTTKDVARILRHYVVAWNKQQIIVVGYSFGADIAPFIVNRLPDDLRNSIASVNLLGLADSADFEVHVSGWLGVNGEGLPTVPQIERLAMPVLCVYGDGETDSACSKLTGPQKSAQIHLAEIGDGHHFGDRYDEIADKIVALLRRD